MGVAWPKARERQTMINKMAIDREPGLTWLARRDQQKYNAGLLSRG